MDASAFDRLAQSLTAGSSRRTVSRLLTGLPMIGLWRGVSDASDALAKRKKRKKKKQCKGGKTRCGKKCLDLQSDPLRCGSCSNVCNVGKDCVDGTCSCPEGEKDCDGECIPQDECCADADCGAGGACSDGTCDCPVGKASCGGICADLATDGANCSACGNTCATGACVNGTCTCATADDCPAGCGCIPRLDGGLACADNPPVFVGCDGDEDCPIGTFCADLGSGACTGICQA